MARTITQLNSTKIDKAKPQEKEFTLSDGKGLYLLVKPNGAKLWRFNYYKPFTQPKKRALIGVGNTQIFPYSKQEQLERSIYLYLRRISIRQSIANSKNKRNKMS